MAYFEDLSKTKAPSTLWSTYSMLKKTLRQNENVDISEYKNLIDLLKIKAKGFEPKKAKVFTSDEIKRFINEAPNEQHVATKVGLIIGVQGACRKDEMHKLLINNVSDRGSYYAVTLPKTKTNITRTFVIEEPLYNIVKEYISHRPKDIESSNFFLNWQKGKCTRQVIGINKLGSMPLIIAKFIKLPQSELYTGHCFRRTSATILADAGADITMLKRHGGWKSNQVAEGYIEDSIENKRKISNLISTSILKASATINTNAGCCQSSNEGFAASVSTSKDISMIKNKENNNSPAITEIRGSDLLRMTNCQHVTVNIYNEVKK